MTLVALRELHTPQLNKALQVVTNTCCSHCCAKWRWFLVLEDTFNCFGFQYDQLNELNLLLHHSAQNNKPLDRIMGSSPNKDKESNKILY